MKPTPVDIFFVLKVFLFHVAVYENGCVESCQSGESHEEREKRASGWLSRDRCVAESSAMRETRNERTYFSG